jgi:hypothetical protein
MKRFFSGSVRFLSSYGLACIVLALLCLLVFLGTIEQVRLGLFEAQKRYFASWFVVYPLELGSSGYHIPVPLPGVMLLLFVFSVNIILGGLLRLRRKPSHIGLFIVHGGILFLLLGGFVTYAVGYDGQMTLAPGESSSKFQSYHDWEFAVVDPSSPDHDTDYTVPQKRMLGLSGDATLTLRPGDLPFDVALWRYAQNADVAAKGPAVAATAPVVDGFYVQKLAPDTQVERNLPAVYATLTDRKTGETKEAILWGNSLAPLVAEYGGKPYYLYLRHTTWYAPFAIKLDKFIRKFHPGTTEPSDFESEIEKIDDRGSQNVVIRMNEPMRSKGYVFFQASYIEDPQTHELSSTLAVAKNPADQFPLYACVIITFGMLLHFGGSLTRYLRRERERLA